MTVSNIKTLESATAVSTGGRNGHSETDDGSVTVDLSVRKGMGGPGKEGTTTPEHLFAAGYAACFGGAVDFAASQHKVKIADAKVTCKVDVGPRDAGGFGIAVKMKVESQSVPTEQLREIVNEAHEKICPYSHATRDNIPFELEVVGA
ncbi:peroxiredoxin, Ohr subfamily [Rhodoblastus acidophilus]|uniref:Peroxiredoxin, Ohr subfamily n=1 Tax=Rhodoblastus acidophilus TaxID=1074 RepID=A0A212RZM8_RHOAC|nr:organic hydroperoxide resistance protein [Rhodoblastus acidophilus]PPQ36912.1 organic hydroperoxide resistance protein [Rhodoblastus acidophilus]RAI22450.1 organic hydroperoxide resistance protein [Rhodoblastus acidophilus]SNB78109.1 peroxiredoxin, Ohr subfamily [Rhodoblastus acidophilus]